MRGPPMPRPDCSQRLAIYGPRRVCFVLRFRVRLACMTPADSVRRVNSPLTTNGTTQSRCYLEVTVTTDQECMVMAIYIWSLWITLDGAGSIAMVGMANVRPAPSCGPRSPNQSAPTGLPRRRPGRLMDIQAAPPATGCNRCAISPVGNGSGNGWILAPTITARYARDPVTASAPIRCLATHSLCLRNCWQSLRSGPHYLHQAIGQHSSIHGTELSDYKQFQCVACMVTGFNGPCHAPTECTHPHTRLIGGRGATAPCTPLATQPSR